MTTLDDEARLEGRAGLAAPQAQVQVQAPPALPERDANGGLLLHALPLVGSVGSILLVATMGGPNRGRGLLAAGMFLVATLAYAIAQLDRQRRQHLDRVTSSRTHYLAHLDAVRTEVRRAADLQHRTASRRHPEPDALPVLAAEPSCLWGRRPADPDFLHVRYALSSQPLALDLEVEERAAGHEPDPVAESALRRLVGVHAIQAGLPAVLDLHRCTRLSVEGDASRARAMARSLICSATASHRPEDLAVAVLSSPAHLAQWDWVKWLPHAHSTTESDAAGPRRMVVTTTGELASLLPADPARRAHLLVVTDGVHLRPDDAHPSLDGRMAVSVVDLAPHDGRGDPDDAMTLRLFGAPVRGGKAPAELVSADGTAGSVLVDQCAPATAEAFARRLMPLAVRPPTSRASGSAFDLTTARPDHLELMGLGDIDDFDPEAAWRPHTPRDHLRVPFGVDATGHPVHLDIKESAQQGMGPHGLVIGATGSGKSEFLRTLVLGLAMTHSPAQLNFVLVDFKGGATFAGMAELPHVSALITNLADELTLVDRMQDALAGEMTRRQELLRRAGNFASLRDYEAARSGGDALPPLPSLFIVVDEFSELLTARPEFIELFVAIGRLGRSLGLHLLLASQRLEEGRLRGLESHLSYRIGLRTFSSGESRTVIGVPDAHQLPAVPGLGYLRPDPATLVRFKAAYVSGPPVPRPASRSPASRQPEDILPFSVSRVAHPDDAPDPVRVPAPRPAEEQRSLIELAGLRMSGHGPSAHPVWLPPLGDPESLDTCMPDVAVDPDLGLVSSDWRRRPGLVVPIGTLDRPREQCRDTLVLDLGGASGHVAVIGGPRSGKSTLLCTVVTAIALTTTPLESQFYLLDLGGGLAPLGPLPHSCGIAARSEPDVVRRIVSEVASFVERREGWFRERGIESIEAYRELRSRGEVDDGWGEVFLVVDGWHTLRSEFDDLEAQVQALASRGLAVGLHVVCASPRWADFRPAMRDLLGSRFELRLGDPHDSELDRRTAALVPPGRPGRGITPDRLHFLAALPRVDGSSAPGRDGIDDLVHRSREAWRGPEGPKLRLLPERVGLAEVREDAVRLDVPGSRLLLGVAEKDLAPVALDVRVEPHLLVFGDRGSGKSALLRTYLHEVLRTRGPREAQVVLVDHRRSLLGEVPDEHLLHHLTSGAQAGPALGELATYLEGRLPGPDVTAQQLRTRSWWSGADVFVVVDDYDLVASAGSPLSALQPLLAQAGDIGLHVVVARPSGGAARSLHDPVLQSLRDLAMPGILLSGSRDDGPLIGNLRPQPAGPGRARLVTRDAGTQTLQLAWVDPAF